MQGANGRLFSLGSLRWHCNLGFKSLVTNLWVSCLQASGLERHNRRLGCLGLNRKILQPTYIPQIFCVRSCPFSSNHSGLQLLKKDIAKTAICQRFINLHYPEKGHWRYLPSVHARSKATSTKCKNNSASSTVSPSTQNIEHVCLSLHTLFLGL
jgi:hypothetical protein